MANSLKEIWNQDHKLSIDKDCWWISQTGKWHKLQTMNVFHLYHALILIWNHKIPEEYQLPPFNSYHLKCTRAKRRYLIANLYLELMNRTTTKDMKKVMMQIALWVVFAARKEAPARLW